MFEGSKTELKGEMWEEWALTCGRNGSSERKNLLAPLPLLTCDEAADGGSGPVALGTPRTHTRPLEHTAKQNPHLFRSHPAGKAVGASAAERRAEQPEEVGVAEG